jgi:hypothetical protein
MESSALLISRGSPSLVASSWSAGSVERHRGSLHFGEFTRRLSRRPPPLSGHTCPRLPRTAAQQRRVRTRVTLEEPCSRRGGSARAAVVNGPPGAGRSSCRKRGDRRSLRACPQRRALRSPRDPLGPAGTLASTTGPRRPPLSNSLRAPESPVRFTSARRPTPDGHPPHAPWLASKNSGLVPSFPALHPTAAPASSALNGTATKRRRSSSRIRRVTPVPDSSTVPTNRRCPS